MSMDIEKKDGAIPRLLDEIVINYGGGCCLYNSDCLDILRTLPDGSVDMILQDPPYNMTNCKWEYAIDLQTLWQEWKRVCRGVVVMTAAQPFVTDLIVSNREGFQYDLIWRKSNTTGHLNVNKMPLRQHEYILVFGKGTYNPQMWRKETPRAAQRSVDSKGVYGKIEEGVFRIAPDEMGFPRSVLDFNTAYHDREAGLHPTQKPVDLFRYLIRTYTNEGETVFDGYGGSGTTAVACIKENRKYIVCEKEAEYIETTKKRIDEATRHGDLFSAVGCCPHDL